MYDVIRFYNIKEGEEVKIINAIIEKFENFVIIYDPFKTIISDIFHRQKLNTKHVSYMVSKDLNLTIIIYESYSYNSVRFFPSMIGLLEEINVTDQKPRYQLKTIYNSIFGGYGCLDIDGDKYDFSKSKEIIYHLNYDRFIFRGDTPKRLVLENLLPISMLDVSVKLLNEYKGE